MEEQKKVFIRGRKGRGSEVIDILKGLGATKKMDIGGEAQNTIYFINHDNNITCAPAYSEIGAIVMDYYKEIELPRQKWIEDDILTLDKHKGCYAVFKKYNNDDTFVARLLIDNNGLHFNTKAYVEPYRLANAEEIKDASKAYGDMFYNFLTAGKRLLK